jgi:Kef-type K+ transport system membrane component KefB
MSFSFLPIWPPQFSDAMQVAVALMLAGLVGEGLARFFRLPRVSGYALTGLILGPSVLGWFGQPELTLFRIVIDLALALLLFELGVRVELRWFRSNPWILLSSIAESALTFAGTYVALMLLGSSSDVSLLVAAIVIGTSPAIIMRVATELRAEGQVTQRVLVHTALNILYSIVLLKLIIGSMHGNLRNDWSAAVLHPVYLLSGSILMGAAIALSFGLLRRGFRLSDEQEVAILFGLLLLATSFLQMFALPTLMAPLLAGIIVKQWDRRPHLWPRHLGTAGGVLMLFVFVLTGATLSIQDILTGGLAALVLITIRVVCKGLGVALFGPVSGLSWRQSLSLGLALQPMSTVAYLLVEEVRSSYPALGREVGEVVISMIAVLGIIGPIAVQWALRFNQETKEGER